MSRASGKEILNRAVEPRSVVGTLDADFHAIQAVSGLLARPSFEYEDRD